MIGIGSGLSGLSGLSGMVGHKSTLLNGLVAYWPLTEASGDRSDLGPNGYTLTPTGTPLPGNDTGLVYPTAATFLRSSDDDGLTNSTAPKDWWVGKSFTIAAWVYLTSYPDSSPLYTYIDEQCSWGGGYALFVTGFALCMRLHYLGTTMVTHAPSDADSWHLNTWYLCRGWYDFDAQTDNSQVNLFAKDTQSFTTAPLSVTEPLYIGRDNLSAGKTWDGKIGPVGHWSRVLTDAEWTSLYNAGAGKKYPF